MPDQVNKTAANNEYLTDINKIIGVIFVLLFIALLSGVLFLFQKDRLIDIFGLPADPATLKLVPEGFAKSGDLYNLPYDQDVVVHVVLNTGQSEVDSVEAKLNYNPDILSAQEIIYSNAEITQLQNTLVSSIKKTGDQEEGLITISRTAIPLPPYPDPDNLPAYDPAPANSEGIIASIRFRTLQEVSNASIAFDFTLQDDPVTPEKENRNDSNVVRHDSNGEDVLGSVENLGFRTSPVGQTATLYFEPNQSTMKTGERTEVKVMLDTAGNEVDSVDAVINFDKSKMNVTEVVKGTAFVNLVEPAGVPIIDTQNAIVRFSTNIGADSSPTPVIGTNLHVATLIIDPIAVGSATLAYEYDGFEVENDSNVSAYLQGKDILGDVLDGTYTVEQGDGTGSGVSVIVSLQLQGRQRPQADKSAPVRLQVLNSADTLQQEVNFNLSDMGVSPSIPLSNVDPGTYTVLVKPVGYLQKQFSVTLQEGENTPDFSTHMFLGGDLDISGKVNVLDYNSMLSQWNNTRQDSAEAAVSDLDGSNYVNSLDYSIMISNWNKSGDREG